MRALLRKVGSFYVRCLGSRIRDEESGEVLGKALVVVWAGRIHLIGFTGTKALRPMFCTQDKVRYWRQAIGFTGSTPPDFPRQRPE